MVFALFFLRKIKAKYLKAFFIYSILLAFTITSAFYAAVILKSKLLYFVVVNISTLLEYGILALFFYYLLKNKLAKKIVLFSTIPFFIFSSIVYFKSSIGAGFSINVVIVHFLTFLVILGYYLVEKLNSVAKTPFLSTISFRVCVGLLIYFAGNLFFLMYITYTKDVALKKQMKLINSFVSIAKDIILALAWLGCEPTENNEDLVNLPSQADYDIQLAELRSNDTAPKNLKNNQ